MKWMTCLAMTAALGVLPAGSTAQDADAGLVARARKLLDEVPLVDGHNDLPWELRQQAKSRVAAIDLRGDTRHLADPYKPLHTDIPRLRKGGVGAQFWSVYVPVRIQGGAAVQATFEQIDIVHRLARHYPEAFEVALTAADVVRIHQAGRVASLIGMEGGHSIGNSLAALRQLYAAGARYMTVTHSSNTDWADSATDAPKHGGLSRFGEEVIREMNRLGLLIDLSHVSPEAMKDAMAVSAAPVIFSHSSARALTNHSRNVPDDVLAMMRQDGGVVMVTFVPSFVSEEVRLWDAEEEAAEARFATLYRGQPDEAKKHLEAWRSEHPEPQATLVQVADHIEHVRKVAGLDHVGIGSDFDGIGSTPVGLEGVETYPALLAELLRRGWTDAEIKKLAGENLLRVLRQAEQVAARLQKEREPSEALIEDLDGPAKS